MSIIIMFSEQRSIHAGSLVTKSSLLLEKSQATPSSS
jgi:hypothetical protein